MFKQTKIKSIKYIGKSDVYNMEVESHHNFSVNGGLIVHNCLDAIRYHIFTILRHDIEEKYSSNVYLKGKDVKLSNKTDIRKKGGQVF